MNPRIKILYRPEKGVFLKSTSYAFLLLEHLSLESIFDEMQIKVFKEYNDSYFDKSFCTIMEKKDCPPELDFQNFDFFLELLYAYPPGSLKVFWEAGYSFDKFEEYYIGSFHSKREFAKFLLGESRLLNDFYFAMHYDPKKILQDEIVKNFFWMKNGFYFRKEPVKSI